ncbi:MAG TPA: DNA repair protein RadA [Syntrophales bacterium]|nr:DNA repair protein RadA [Syntrophales bacterium]HPQ45520.1 DNA repair protein RadA [Syntrophales bacterium]
MKKIKTTFFCQNCGQQSAKWLGKCPSCGEWNQFVEEEVRDAPPGGFLDEGFNEKPMSIDTIEADETDRLKTGIAEIDRVLGGGIVGGSAVLIGGDPGIGKSTLLLQVMQNLAENGLVVLYVSGEESASQIKLRGRRVGASSKNLMVLVEVSLENILKHIQDLHPGIVVIDSIQTVYSSELTSAPGSVSQIREASGRLIMMSKKTGIPLFLIGHVTKEGSIAGPKILEHMVDTVLYFEGDSGHTFRIVRNVKNRYGPTNEIGVFEMRERGLVEVLNPSALFLSERPQDAVGSVVVPSIEGTRPVLVEIQSLVSENTFGIPRRTTIGVDRNRVSLLAAVVEKVCGLHLGNHDIFINVAGGVKLDEPAVDLGIVASMMSSFLDRSIDAGTVVCGEVGLTGEVRGVGRINERVKEAFRMGFTRCILPETSSVDMLPETQIHQHAINSISALPEYLF